MKPFPFLFVLCAAFAALSGECLAHRVNVFAFVDGEQIRVECSFTRSQKVKNGKIVVTDLETGGAVLEGVTDGQGVFLFRPSDEFLATGHGLNIRLLAGEGHQDDWRMPPEELRALSPLAGSIGASPPGIRDAAPPQRKAETDETPDAPEIAVDSAALEAMIGRVLDSRLEPIKASLARQRREDPGLRDIIGGIGWIIGLLGLATYMKYKR